MTVELVQPAATVQPPLQRWGQAILAVGAGVLLAAAFLTPPWVYLGLILAGTGALAIRAPLLRLPGWWIGVAFTLWVACSCLAAWLAGYAGAQPRLPGAALVWLAVPLVGTGLATKVFRLRAWRCTLVVASFAIVIAGLQYVIGLGDSRDLLKINPAGTRFAFARGFSEHHLTFGLACALLSVGVLQPAGVLCLPAWLTWMSRGLAIVGLTFCGSRAAVLGALAGLLSSLTARGRRWIGLALVLVAVLGGAAIVRLYVTDRPRFDRMLRLEDGRWPIWRTALRMAEAHPLLGYGGKDGFKAAYPKAFAQANPGVNSEFSDGAGHAHNMALALATEYGLPALALHLAFWIVVLHWLWRRRREAPDGWRLGLGVAAVAFVGGQFEPYPTRIMQGAAIHAFLGLAVALALSPKPTNSAPEASP